MVSLFPYDVPSKLPEEDELGMQVSAELSCVVGLYYQSWLYFFTCKLCHTKTCLFCLMIDARQSFWLAQI